MPDQIIDAAMAVGLHADACRAHVLVGWIVMQDRPEYPDKVIARLVTDEPSPYVMLDVMLADTLAELQASMPSGLVRMKRTPMDPPDVVEVWFRK